MQGMPLKVTELELLVNERHEYKWRATVATDGCPYDANTERVHAKIWLTEFETECLSPLVEKIAQSGNDQAGRGIICTKYRKAVLTAKSY